ncbi:hypothetical protein J6590_011548 [Homalodisca vitripennis]|nr:hypothetical protein J6590_011548 [Homalodisca vitripennis]
MKPLVHFSSGQTKLLRVLKARWPAEKVLQARLTLDQENDKHLQVQVGSWRLQSITQLNRFVRSFVVFTRIPVDRVRVPPGSGPGRTIRLHNPAFVDLSEAWSTVALVLLPVKGQHDYPL